jgi:hypothetical protein
LIVISLDYQHSVQANPSPSYVSPAVLHLQEDSKSEKKTRTCEQKHTTGGIPRWSPTLVLVARFSAYVWQSGRDAQFSLTYGRMYLVSIRIEHNVCNTSPDCTNATNRPRQPESHTATRGLISAKSRTPIKQVPRDTVVVFCCS